MVSVNDVIQNNGIHKYEKVAGEMLAVNEPEQIIAALLKLNYEKDLDATAYKHIKELSGGGANMDKPIRLFIAKGKMDDYNARKLVDFIEKETGVRQRMINNVKVMEKFSFFTVPYEQSEQIISHFKKHNKGKRSIVERAKD